MKRDIDDSNTQMSDKFNEIREMFKNLKEDRPSKTLIEREVEALSKVQAAGIKMVTREMEKRVDAFSQTLKYKILETRHDIDLKTDNILKLASKDITTLRDDIIAHFKANKVISRNGVRHLEAVSDENRNLTIYHENAKTDIGKCIQQQSHILKRGMHKPGRGHRESAQTTNSTKSFIINRFKKET